MFAQIQRPILPQPRTISNDYLLTVRTCSNRVSLSYFIIAALKHTASRIYEYIL